MATYPITDLRLRVAAQSALRKNTPFDMSAVNVGVNQGEVALYGVVSCPAAAEAAMRIVAATGVRRVCSELTVARWQPSGETGGQG